MNKRLQQFLAAENISQAQFADTIGVARASISHILAGRNKPGFDFIESTARHFPALNLEWLITGRGRMYNSAKTAPDGPAGPISPLADTADDTLFTEPEYRTEKPLSPLAEPQKTFNNSLDKITQSFDNQKTITKVIIYYSDNTFQEIP